MHVAHNARLVVAAPVGPVLSELWSRVSAVALAAVQRLAQVGCGLSGHEMLFCFEPSRVSLRCLHCGQHTPGWTMPPRAFGPGGSGADVARSQMVRPMRSLAPAVGAPRGTATISTKAAA